ncbi:30S ribosome-binding factor RbfA [Povalibacter sp.]|uniref:30S ribosome-binding factor RbfA n=1 Tax=Povalibacter sp. TaxID=1962978 RepID=UPI002F3E2913
MTTRSRSNRAFPRHRRVGQQIQRALSDLIRREIRDPRLGMVTLTEVRVTSDLSYATIYYSVLNAKPEEAHEVLQSVAEILRGPLGRALQLRHAPELRFVPDELIEGGARLSALINKAVSQDVSRHIDEPPEDSPEDSRDDSPDDPQDDSVDQSDNDDPKR